MKSYTYLKRHYKYKKENKIFETKQVKFSSSLDNFLDYLISFKVGIVIEYM